MTRRTHIPQEVNDMPGSRVVVRTHTDQRRWTFHVVDGEIDHIDWERFDGGDRGTKRPATLSRADRERVLWAAANPDLVDLARYIRESTAAQGLDKWATDQQGLPAGQWATMTGRDPSTVSRNTRRAE